MKYSIKRVLTSGQTAGGRNCQIKIGGCGLRVLDKMSELSERLSDKNKFLKEKSELTEKNLGYIIRKVGQKDTNLGVFETF